MTRRCSCLPDQGSSTVKDPACPVHGEDAAPAWAKVVAFLVAVPVIIVLLALVMILGFGAVAHAIHWAGHQ